VIISESQWRDAASAHARRAEQWTVPHLDRRRRAIKHPVMDFLFDYYPYSPGRLRTWHPGLGVRLEGAWSPPSLANHYTFGDDGWTVDPERADPGRLDVTLRILRGTQSRPAQHSCFGMHEWAMVYRLDPTKLRHQHENLRVDPDVIVDTVDHVGLRCTHIDAYRFFTSDAEPLNAHIPTRANQPDIEQPGCIHANMDLFKYAMWFQPYLSGALILDCFELTAFAREIDMRASPYDLTHLGYTSIRVETPEGRREYAQVQQEVAARASDLRTALIESLTELEFATTRVVTGTSR
jgi:hypothetical protein